MARELKTSGVRNQMLELQRVVDAGHPFRDYVEMAIAQRLRDVGEIADVPEHWLRDSEDQLRNRIGFVQLLEQYFESEDEPFQICTFHLDRFRQINQRLGVAEGDRLLAAFVALLRELLPGDNNDHRMARLFGATAIVFLPKTDRNGAEVTAERIRQAVEASSIELPSGPIECTISCVIIEAAQRQSPDEIIDRISPIIQLINKSGGNRTGAENEGVPEVIERRAFQVEALVVRDGKVEHVGELATA
jgi:diguanylate cyclase (GGDEF)-like protein